MFPFDKIYIFMAFRIITFVCMRITHGKSGSRSLQFGGNSPYALFVELTQHSRCQTYKSRD